MNFSADSCQVRYVGNCQRVLQRFRPRFKEIVCLFWRYTLLFVTIEMDIARSSCNEDAHPARTYDWLCYHGLGTSSLLVFRTIGHILSCTAMWRSSDIFAVHVCILPILTESSLKNWLTNKASFGSCQTSSDLGCEELFQIREREDRDRYTPHDTEYLMCISNEVYQMNGRRVIRTW